MQSFFQSAGDSFQIFVNMVGDRWWKDLIDILLITYVVYEVITLVRQTRAAQFVRGIIILLIAYFISWSLELKTVKFLLDNVLQFGLVVIVVIFQPELRRALEQVGRSRISPFSLFSGKVSSEELVMWREAVNTVCDSAERMSRDRTGGLIVIERKTPLGEIARTGTAVDAKLTSELIETIFYEGSPLHDGAVIIRKGKLDSAGCILPVSQNNEISKDMGTRHRAALGMSENSDAIVVVISEETGIISIAQDGVFIRRLDKPNLYKILNRELVNELEENEETTKGFWGRIIKK